ncbi:MAG: hypothetical protein A2148_00760 [Chloroflexi bacterium RBG_16_68_14]|nr:MAG: hypothetical protein A2148_00760 [Chloroflexi bacterium RBG_16_68_14]
MAARGGKVNLSHRELKTGGGEQEALLHALRQQIRDLESERDQALRGLELLTEALRRRGCCDHHTNGGSF